MLVGARDGEDRPRRIFLERFEAVPIDPTTADAAVALRYRQHIRVADATIRATARARDALPVRGNTCASPAGDPSLRAPYAS